MTTDTASFPFLSPYGGTAASLSPFVVMVDLAVGCLSSIDFHLAVSANEGISGFDFQIPVGQPSGRVLDESFETWPPPGWGIVNSGGGCLWESTATTGRPNYAGGAGAAADADSDWCGPDATMDTELRTPVLDLSDAGAATLEFTASYFDGISGGAPTFSTWMSWSTGARAGRTSSTGTRITLRSGRASR